MAFFDLFRRSQVTTASLAKDRLQIIVARERGPRNGQPDYLPKLKQELLQVIAKYEKIDLDQVSVNLGHSEGCDVLELNIVLAEEQVASAANPLARKAPRAASISISTR